MRRRAVLRAGIGLAAVGGTGVSRAHPGHTPTTTAAGYAPLGSVELPGAADCRIAADGETAFVAVGDGFAAVSLPDLEPLAAVRDIEADRESGPLTAIGDLALDGDRLLVPGPVNPRPDRLSGFALFDVADPASPEQLAFYETTYPIHNAALADDRAYLTAGLHLVVVDVTADEPATLGRWSLADVDERWTAVPPGLRVLHDIRVRGDLAVLSQWDAGTWLVDVADPTSVVVAGRAGGQPPDALAAVEDVRAGVIGLPGNHHSSALSADGSVLAVGAEAFDTPGGDGSGGPGGIELYDVADPSAPAHLSSIDAPVAADETTDGTWTTAHDFAFAGDRLLSAWYQGGVRIHDVSDPAAPEELAWWRQPAEAAFWTALPAVGDTFVASSTTLPDERLRAGLYLFPNRAGEQADPPSLTEPTPTATASSPRTRTTTPGPRSPTPSATGTPTASASPTSTPGQPGFGLPAAFGGLAGVAAWRRWRRSTR